MGLIESHKLRKLHRWLGLLFCLGAFLSSGSGVIHTLMTHSQEPPPSARPSGGLTPALIKVSVADALQKLKDGKDAIQAVNLRTIEGVPWYQVFVTGQAEPQYISAETGVVDPSRDECYAAQIAANFLGGAAVAKSDYITQFNSEYLNIFRLLPVYRFDADDGKGTRVYVSTATGSVARHTDNRRQLEANIFSNFHKLAFIPNRTLRDYVLVTLTGGVFVASLAGLVLFFATLPRRKKGTATIA